MLRLAQDDIDTLAPQEWVDYFSGWVGVAIFEGLYEWDYLARPARLFPNTTAELTGEIANRLLTNGKLKREYASAGIRHYALPETYARYTYFNLNDPMLGGFSKEHVSLRRAIALAFDARALIRVAYAGQAVALAQIVPPGVTNHDPGLPQKDAVRSGPVRNRRLAANATSAGLCGTRRGPKR